MVVVVATVGAAFLVYQLVRRRKKGVDLPPFQWDTTVEQIEADAQQVLEDAEATLDAVANASEPLTYAKVVRPLQLAPNYKTNPLLCQSKFLQHCSTDPEIRAAAEEAGTQFAAFKASSRRRADVYQKVQEYAETQEAKGLGTYERHFLDALLADFRRGGLGLASDAERTELQRLLDADTACCSKYKVFASPSLPASVCRWSTSCFNSSRIVFNSAAFAFTLS